MLTKALELRPDYDDAMAYMNLIFRERAAIDCGDPAARAADLRMAKKSLDLTLATKNNKQSHRGPGGSGGGGGGGAPDTCH